MPRLLTTCALGIAAALATSAAAHAACPGVTQLEMNTCAAASAKQADAALNAAYARMGRSKSLITAQKAWIDFRDAECRYEANIYRGGSMQPMVYSMCIERVTKARTAELTKLIKDRPN